LQEIWDNTFNPNLAEGDTPPELWNFDTNFSLPDPNANFMHGTSSFDLEKEWPL
jgi:hypothetical protein